MNGRLNLTCLVLLCFAGSYLASCSTAPSHRPPLEFKEAPSPSVKGQFPNWLIASPRVGDHHLRESAGRQDTRGGSEEDGTGYDRSPLSGHRG
jgi:hypothetical protein